MNEEEKLIKEQWDKLPTNLQQAINAVPWKTVVQEIAKSNNFNAEQTANLERETMFVLYAFENPTDYVANVLREVGVSEDVADTIAESVATKIFEPIWQKANKKEGKSVAGPANLPMIERGETAHEVPHVEEMQKPAEKPKVSLPDYRYLDGQDPYREQLT